MAKVAKNLSRFESPLRVRLFIRRLHEELRADPQCIRYFKIIPLEAVFSLHEALAKKVFSDVHINWAKSVPKPFRGMVPFNDYLAFFSALDRTCDRMKMNAAEKKLMMERMDGFGDYCLKFETVPENSPERVRLLERRLADDEKAASWKSEPKSFWQRLFKR